MCVAGSNPDVVFHLAAQVELFSCAGRFVGDKQVCYDEDAVDHVLECGEDDWHTWRNTSRVRLVPCSMMAVASASLESKW